MLLCNCFTDTEDSATLGSDTSAISGLREAVHVYCLFCFPAIPVIDLKSKRFRAFPPGPCPGALPLGNQGDKPRGLGRSPIVIMLRGMLPPKNGSITKIAINDGARREPRLYAKRLDASCFRAGALLRQGAGFSKKRQGSLASAKHPPARKTNNKNFSFY